MNLIYHLLLLLLTSGGLSAQSGTYSFFLSGSLIFNNNEDQAVGDYGIQFTNPNSALNAELSYRRYGEQRLSVETGLQLSARYFKTIAFDRRDTTTARIGRIAAGRPVSISVPLRFFLGKRAAQRTDLNQAGGLYVGTLLRYSAHRRGDKQGAVQYGVYRAAVPNLSAFLLLGARRPGRLLDFNFELMAPIRGFRREVPAAGLGQGYRWWEVFFTVGVGHWF